MLRLLEKRRALQMSQADLEEVSGISQTMISRYELGQSDPTAEGIRRLSRALGVSSDWLLGMTDDPTPRHVIPAELSQQEMRLITAVRRGDVTDALRTLADTLEN